jgi:hypothetical protein
MSVEFESRIVPARARSGSTSSLPVVSAARALAAKRGLRGPIAREQRDLRRAEPRARGSTAPRFHPRRACGCVSPLRHIGIIVPPSRCVSSCTITLKHSRNRRVW